MKPIQQTKREWQEDPNSLIILTDISLIILFMIVFTIIIF